MHISYTAHNSKVSTSSSNLIEYLDKENEINDNLDGVRTQESFFDTNYNSSNTVQDLKTNDKYQMFTYGRNFKRKETLLLYPKHIFDVDEDLKLGKDDSLVNLKMRSIDLKTEDFGFDEYIEEIRKRIKNVI